MSRPKVISNLNHGQHVRDRMKDLRSDLDFLKFFAIRGESNSREINELIYQLEEKFSNAEERLRDLSLSQGEIRGHLQSGFDRAWEEAAYAIDRAKARLLH